MAAMEKTSVGRCATRYELRAEARRLLDATQVLDECHESRRVAAWDDVTTAISRVIEAAQRVEAGTDLPDWQHDVVAHVAAQMQQVVNDGLWFMREYGAPGMRERTARRLMTSTASMAEAAREVVRIVRAEAFNGD